MLFIIKLLKFEELVAENNMLQEPQLIYLGSRKGKEDPWLSLWLFTLAANITVNMDFYLN